MLPRLLLLLLTLSSATCSDDPGLEDVVEVPGYPEDQSPKVYAGYLNADTEGLRRLHYVLIQSPTNPGNKPLTLWLNGGPGCSSKLGFLQQIGPYFLDINAEYQEGDMLKENKYAWTRESNLLFLDSPAGVGLSQNDDQKFVYNDANTADDNLRAIVYFFEKKFPSYKEKDFFITGESYAGKYIPDLALRIHTYNKNAAKKISLKGLLIGNGVLDFTDGSLDQSRIQFFFTHNFIDPTLQPYWYNSCLPDPKSAGCAFFYKRCEEILFKTNPYNIYYPCYDPKSPSQRNFMIELSKWSQFSKRSQFSDAATLGDCENMKGVENYFHSNNVAFHSDKTNFAVCNWTIFDKYEVTNSGSMLEIPQILTETDYRVHLFNGDFDDVVPFTDTLKNLEKMGFRQSGALRSWKIKDQNIGMKREFVNGDKKLKFWTIKGAGHEVPQYKREAAYELFNSFLSNSDNNDGL